MMTYLSQFPGAKYAPRIGRFRDIDIMPAVGVNTQFAVQMIDPTVNPQINIRGPTKSLVPYTQFRLSATVYKFIYQPEIVGEYKVISLFN